MTAATVLNLGQANLAGDTRALFLKVWAGEVLTAFQTANKFMERSTMRRIASGKSAQFPATWKVSSGYHTPGTEVLGQTAALNERTITIDDFLVSSVFVAAVDELIAHYDVRGTYSAETGFSLSATMDKNIAATMILAARAAATVTGGFGGTSLTSTGTEFKTVAATLLAGIQAACQAMDEKDIPEVKPRSVFLRPAQYALLANMQANPLIHVDYNAGASNGSYAEGTLLKVAGATLVKTNQLPNSNVTTGPATYQGDFSKTAFVVTTPDSVGTVMLADLSTTIVDQPEKLGTLILSKYLVGHGILRPECAVEGKTTA